MKIIFPLVVYLLVCIFAILSPSPEGYDTLLWKLFIGQIYAIPSFIVTLFIFLAIRNRKLKNREQE